jgi:hypothetical protein
MRKILYPENLKKTREINLNEFFFMKEFMNNNKFFHKPIYLRDLKTRKINLNDFFL